MEHRPQPVPRSRSARRIAIGAALALVGSLLVTGVAPRPAEAAPLAQFFDGDPIVHRHGDERFILDITLSVGENDVGVIDITFRQVHNPDGVARGTQEATYNQEVNFSVNGSSGLFRPTTAQMAGRGRANMDFSRMGPTTSRCGGRITEQDALLDGFFRFESKTQVLGTFELDEVTGTFTTLQGFCTKGSVCPPQALSFNGGNGTNTFISGDRLDDKAQAFFFRQGPLPDGWERADHTFNQMPANRITADQVLTTGTIQGFPGTGVSGEGEFSGDDPLDFGPSPCGDDRSFTEQGRFGDFEGDLRAAALVGKPIVLHGPGSMRRTIVSNGS